ncbi:MAG: hypothetical protein AABY05_02295 [Nanoarchaeota archaeon]
MNNKFFLVIAVPLFAISVVSLALYLVNYQGSDLSNSPKNLESCKTLVFNGEGAINLVFFSTEREAKQYSEHLLSVDPFKNQKEKFNIYYISDYEPKCEIYKGIALLCYSNDLIKKASSCPNDYILVVKKEDANVRSSSYTNVMSINSVHPLSVLTHEFGHSFANFAEEYVPAKLPRGTTNCVASCEDFSGEKNGCYEGCSDAEYKRSIEDGVMRTLSTDDYGIFNKNFVQKRIDEEYSENVKTITGNVVKDSRKCEEEKYYAIEGEYNAENNEVKFLDKNIETGCVGGNGYGSFGINLIDTKGEAMIKDNFNPELIFTDAPADEGIDGETISGNNKFIIKSPILEDASEIEIEHYDKKTRIDIKDLGGRACVIY